jgi:hypothetical protein
LVTGISRATNPERGSVARIAVVVALGLVRVIDRMGKVMPCAQHYGL